MNKLILDLDLTLVNTSIQEDLKSQIKLSKDKGEKYRLWKEVYKLIPFCILYDGVEELFDYIRNNNIPTIIVSNNSNRLIKKFIDYYKIPIIDFVGRFTLNRFKPIIKPSPLPIMKGVEILGGNDGVKILSVGNETIDIESSNKAMVQSVLCTWGNTEEYNSNAIQHCTPNYIIHHPIELIQLLQ